MNKMTDPKYPKFVLWLKEHEEVATPSAHQIALALGMETPKVARWLRAAGYERNRGRWVWRHNPPKGAG